MLKLIPYGDSDIEMSGDIAGMIQSFQPTTLLIEASDGSQARGFWHPPKDRFRWTDLKGFVQGPVEPESLGDDASWQEGQGGPWLTLDAPVRWLCVTEDGKRRYYQAPELQALFDQLIKEANIDDDFYEPIGLRSLLNHLMRVERLSVLPENAFRGF